MNQAKARRDPTPAGRRQALTAPAGGLISPFVVTRGMAFAVHGTAELAFTGAAGLLMAGNPVLGPWPGPW